MVTSAVLSEEASPSQCNCPQPPAGRLIDQIQSRALVMVLCLTDVRGEEGEGGAVGPAGNAPCHQPTDMNPLKTKVCFIRGDEKMP